MDRLAYRPAAAAKELGISRTKLYQLIAENRLRTYKEGRCRLISRDAMLDYQASKAAS